MANFGIRILSQSGTELEFQAFILNPDYADFPRTHAFGLFVLWEGLKKQGWGRVESSLQELLTQQFVAGDFKARAPVVVEKLEVGHFDKLRDYHSGERIRSYLTAENEFHREAEIPTAIYTLTARVPAFLTHLQAGFQWESEGREMDEMRHYLEKMNGKDRIVLESSMDGRWHVLWEGPEGGEMKETRNRTANYPKAAEVMDQKIRDGYTLLYKNFDTPFGIERQMLEEQNA